MIPAPADLRAACLEWLASRGTPAIAATLTFRPRLDGRRLSVSDARGAVRHYLRRLDTAAYGKGAIRRGLRVGAVPIMEGGEAWNDKHIHYHLEIRVPQGLTSMDWRQRAANEWQRVRWASPRENVFRDVYDAGWLDYILKLRDKPSFIDAVDFENLRIS